MNSSWTSSRLRVPPAACSDSHASSAFSKSCSAIFFASLFAIFIPKPPSDSGREIRPMNISRRPFAVSSPRTLAPTSSNSSRTAALPSTPSQSSISRALPESCHALITFARISGVSIRLTCPGLSSIPLICLDTALFSSCEAV